MAARKTVFKIPTFKYKQNFEKSSLTLFFNLILERGVLLLLTYPMFSVWSITELENMT